MKVFAFMSFLISIVACAEDDERHSSIVIHNTETGETTTSRIDSLSNALNEGNLLVVDPGRYSITFFEALQSFHSQDFKSAYFSSNGDHCAVEECKNPTIKIISKTLDKAGKLDVSGYAHPEEGFQKVFISEDGIYLAALYPSEIIFYNTQHPELGPVFRSGHYYGVWLTNREFLDIDEEFLTFLGKQYDATNFNRIFMEFSDRHKLTMKTFFSPSARACQEKGSHKFYSKPSCDSGMRFGNVNIPHTSLKLNSGKYMNRNYFTTVNGTASPWKGVGPGFKKRGFKLGKNLLTFVRRYL